MEGLPAVQGDTGTEALVLADDDQERRALELLNQAKTYKKDLVADPSYVRIKARVDTAVKALRDYNAGHFGVLNDDMVRLNNGIVTYREEKRRKAADAARTRAEADAAQDAADRDAEAKRLEAAAKRARGAPRKDLLEQLTAVKEETGPSVEGAAQRAAEEVVAESRGRGKGADVRNYFAVVDDLEVLAAAVVGSNPELLRMAKQFVRSSASFCPNRISIQALEGIKRTKGALQPSKWLNDQARANEDKLKIPGVLVDYTTTVRNT